MFSNITPSHPKALSGSEVYPALAVPRARCSRLDGGSRRLPAKLSQRSPLPQGTAGCSAASASRRTPSACHRPVLSASGGRGRPSPWEGGTAPSTTAPNSRALQPSSSRPPHAGPEIPTVTSCRLPSCLCFTSSLCNASVNS